jgi:hypothetical protein
MSIWVDTSGRWAHHSGSEPQAEQATIHGHTVPFDTLVCANSNSAPRHVRQGTPTRGAALLQPINILAPREKMTFKADITRRVLMVKTVAASCATLSVLSAQAQTMMLESDSQARALGYKADASKIDKTQQPKHVAGQICSNCILYQGAANSTAGGCPLFPGKQVAAKAWCSAYAKKG